MEQIPVGMAVERKDGGHQLTVLTIGGHPAVRC